MKSLVAILAVAVTLVGCGTEKEFILATNAQKEQTQMVLNYHKEVNLRRLDNAKPPPLLQKSTRRIRHVLMRSKNLAPKLMQVVKSPSRALWKKKRKHRLNRHCSMNR